MRNFLQTTAGGTFYGGSNVTFVQRKDCVEIVIKMKSGLYGVVTATFDDHDMLMLTTLWGDFFHRLRNSSRPEMLVEKMRRPCPEFYKLATDNADYDLIEFATTNGDSIDGIGKDFKRQPHSYIMHLATAPEIITEAFKLFNYSLTIYRELLNGCPIAEWKTALRNL